jgi:hypothetical protein
MTKEEFRRQLMSQRFGSTMDQLVHNCLCVQLEFNELDADKILDMPSTRFDLLVEELNERNKSGKGNKQNDPKTFG